MSRFKLVLAVALLGVVSLLATGCHTVAPAKVADARSLEGKRNILVVVSDRPDRGFLHEIDRNLTMRGFIVTNGRLQDMGAREQLYLVYEDIWAWDVVMYPKQVTISLYDAKTRKLIGSDEFKSSLLRAYPDPAEITDEMLGRILGEPSGSDLH